jgi:uncharacterized membrane protein YfcA
MNSKVAQNIGLKLIMKYTLIGTLNASCLMTLLHATKGLKYMFEWIPQYSPPLIFGIVGLIFGSFIGGKLAGKMIYKKGYAELWGIISAFVVVWNALLISSLYMILSELIKYQTEIGDLIEDYLFKPFYWITIIGSIPIVTLGVLFGNKLNQKINNVANIN